MHVAQFEGQVFDPASDVLHEAYDSAASEVDLPFSARTVVEARQHRELSAAAEAASKGLLPGMMGESTWAAQLHRFVPALAVRAFAPPVAAAAPAADTAGTAAVTDAVLPAATLGSWLPSHFFASMRALIDTSVASFVLRPHVAPSPAAAIHAPVRQAITELRIINEPDLGAPTRSPASNTHISAVVQQFSGVKHREIPLRLSLSDRFLLFYGAYVPASSLDPMPPLWLATKRCFSVGDIWSALSLSCMRIYACHCSILARP